MRNLEMTAAQPFTQYDEAFYAEQFSGAQRSAQRVLNLLPDALALRSVVDFGCGRGAWLGAALQRGIPRAVGLDGMWVERAQLADSRIEFRPTDLALRVNLSERFDLAISVEVAEHLPQARAASFVEDLCRASDRVLFGAAIKGQGGTHHINEQPQSYWVEHFARCGYTCCDYLRPRIWQDEGVEYWYRQNLFVFVNRASPSAQQDLALLEADRPPMLDVVHPKMLQVALRPLEQPSARTVLWLARRALRRSLGRP